MWELILKYCPENEVEEVKRILGPSLVEQTIDLHDEVSVDVQQVAKGVFWLSMHVLDPIEVCAVHPSICLFTGQHPIGNFAADKESRTRKLFATSS